MTKISQREAHRMKKEVQELRRRLEVQNNAWIREWPQGIHLSSLKVPEGTYEQIKTSRRLGHAVVVTIINSGDIEFYAVKL